MIFFFFFIIFFVNICNKIIKLLYRRFELFYFILFFQEKLINKSNVIMDGKIKKERKKHPREGANPLSILTFA